jgi:hypothetical protein
MAVDWAAPDARTRVLSPRKEAAVIRDLAAARARAERSHPAVCQCQPCKVRRHDAARLAAKTGAP